MFDTLENTHSTESPAQNESSSDSIIAMIRFGLGLVGSALAPALEAVAAAAAPEQVWTRMAAKSKWVPHREHRYLAGFFGDTVAALSRGHESKKPCLWSAAAACAGDGGCDQGAAT